MNALKIKYDQHKSNAGRRGVGFKLTFDEWLNVWGDNIHSRGSRKGFDLVMCRIADKGDYEVGNVYIATVERNARTRGVMHQARKGLQIVKVWLEEETPREAVFDVADDPNNGASVDLLNCNPTGPGFDELCTVWRAPSVDPRSPALYYARVVENPTCRWSAYECNRLAPEDRPASCSDPAWPKTIQERAWTSSIWFTPQS